MSIDSVGLISASIPVSVAGLTAVWAIRQDVSPLRLIERVSALLDRTAPDAPAYSVLSDVLASKVYAWGLKKLRPKSLGTQILTIVSLVAGFGFGALWVLTRAAETFPGSWWGWGIYLLSIVSFAIAIMTARMRRKKIEDWTIAERRRHEAASLPCTEPRTDTEASRSANGL